MNIYALKSIINSIKNIKEKHDANVITSTDDMFKKFIAFAIDKGLGRYHLQLAANDEETCTVYSTKLGGIPYMPKDFDYPRRSDGEPLRLLCQLNFEKLPAIKPFPEKGILQIYLYDGGKLDLLDYQGTEFEQDNFRIVYFEDIIRRESGLKSADDMPAFDNAVFPAVRERMLIAKKTAPSMICSSDYRFDDTVLEFAKKYKMCPKSAKSIMDIPNDAAEPLYNRFTYINLTCTGGNGIFTETDPRRDFPEYRDCDLCLFSLADIEETNPNDNEIYVKADGRFNFLIPSENMIKKDFSRVLMDMSYDL